jgi:hypothetical protein
MYVLHNMIDSLNVRTCIEAAVLDWSVKWANRLSWSEQIHARRPTYSENRQNLPLEGSDGDWL